MSVTKCLKENNYSQYILMNSNLERGEQDRRSKKLMTEKMHLLFHCYQ